MLPLPVDGAAAEVAGVKAVAGAKAVADGDPAMGVEAEWCRSWPRKACRHHRSRQLKLWT